MELCKIAIPTAHQNVHTNSINVQEKLEYRSYVSSSTYTNIMWKEAKSWVLNLKILQMKKNGIIKQ